MQSKVHIEIREWKKAYTLFESLESLYAMLYIKNTKYYKKY